MKIKRKILSMILIIPIIFSLGIATCDPPSSGDWTINNGEYCVNSSIVITMPEIVTISAGGSLSLWNTTFWMDSYIDIYGNFSMSNTTLRMNAEVDDAYFTIYNGGIFRSTNKSTITNGVYDPDALIETYFYDGSTAIIDDTLIERLYDGINIQETNGNIIIENSTIRNGDNPAIALSNTGSIGHRFYNNTFSDISGKIIYLYQSSGHTFIGNTILNVGGGDSQGGFDLYKSHNNTFEDNTIINSTAHGIWIDSVSENNTFDGLTITNTDRDAIRVRDSDNNRFNNVNINNIGEYGLLIEDQYSAYPVNYFSNCTISQTTGGDIYTSGASDTRLVNVTFNKSDTSITGSSTLNVSWYMDVTVLDAGNFTPISGATVTIEDTNDLLRFNGATNAFGQIATQVLNEFDEDSGGKTYFTDYDVSATKLGYEYITNTTSFTLSETVFVMLNTVATLNGTIMDDCDNVVQEGVNVSNPTLGSNLTDSNGVYHLYGIDGTYTISWSKEDYRADSVEVVLSGDTEQNITLHKLGYCAQYGTGDFALTSLDFIGGLIVIIGAVAGIIVLSVIFTWGFKKL